MESAAEWVLLVCSVLLLGLYVAVLAASRSARLSALGLLEAVLALPRWRGARGAEQSPMDSLVVQLMGKKRGEMVTVAQSVSQLFLSIAILQTILTTVTGGDASRIRNDVQDGIMLAAFASQVFATWNRKFGSGHVNLLFVYAVMMLSSTAFVVTTTSSRFAMMLVNTFMVIPRVIFSLAYVKSGTVCLLCVLHTIASSLTYRYLLAEARCEASEVEVVMNVSPSVFSFTDALCSAMMVFLTLGWERTMAKHARQELEVTATRGETTATGRLLNTICDATFELDAGLRIVDDALQLASALQHGYDRSLRGVQAEQLLVAEDRGLFRERITAPVLASQSMANVLHVRMRDSLNNILKVELFHVPLAGSLTGASHLIGVREHADYGEYPFQQLSGGLAKGLPSLCEAPLLGAPSRGPDLPATRFGTPAFAVPESTCSSPEALASCQARASTSSWELQRTAVDGSLLQPLSVRFDAISFTVFESSGTHSELFRPNTSFTRSVPAQQELFDDLSAGVLSLNRTISCVPDATFRFQSTIAIDRDGAVLEGSCSVVLARGRADDANSSPDACQHPVEASLQVVRAMRRVESRRARKLPSGSLSSDPSNSVDSASNRRITSKDNIEISNSSYLQLMMQGLPDEMPGSCRGHPRAASVYGAAAL